jgi:hypothetical protein
MPWAMPLFVAFLFTIMCYKENLEGIKHVSKWVIT